MKKYDVVIIGGSFSGLSLAHHLPKNLNVLVVEAKPSFGFVVESTGLITSHTREEFLSFFDIDSCITNKVSAICVVSTNYDDYFISKTKEPWIYQTDTKKLIFSLAQTVPSNVELMSGISLLEVRQQNETTILKLKNNQELEIETKFLVGADGGRSTVAQLTGLDQNNKFLFGYEEIYEGTINLGDQPEETIYHFWFGEFSLGYGGWLSPTFIMDKPAFRVGLAKLEDGVHEGKKLLADFVKILQEKNIITLAKEKPDCIFGNYIPINKPRKNIQNKNVLLIGDAAGFCGAFAADGVKGAVISAKEAAPLIEKYLQGNHEPFGEILKQKINAHKNLIDYYHRQLRYRWLWNQMKKDRTFKAMYDIIKCEQDNFLNQFCDNKDKQKSLTRSVLKIKYLPKLIKYSLFVLWDMTLGKIWK